MKPTKQLILALREVANDLRNGCEYTWMCPDTCNCGLIAQKLLGLNKDELSTMRYSQNFYGPWSQNCPQTGIPVKEIFRVLSSYGLEPQDYTKIEYLTDGNGNYQDRHDVAAYLDARANELEVERSKECRPKN